MGFGDDLCRDCVGVVYCVCTSGGGQVVRRLMRESSLTRKELSAFKEKTAGVSTYVISELC
jgi:hypothetical protein